MCANGHAQKACTPLIDLRISYLLAGLLSAATRLYRAPAADADIGHHVICLPAAFPRQNRCLRPQALGTDDLRRRRGRNGQRYT